MTVTEHQNNCQCNDCQFVKSVFGKCFTGSEVAIIALSRLPLAFIDRVIMEAKKQAVEQDRKAIMEKVDKDAMQMEIGPPFNGEFATLAVSRDYLHGLLKDKEECPICVKAASVYEPWPKHECPDNEKYWCYSAVSESPEKCSGCGGGCCK